MDPKFWHERWKKNEIGFHEDMPNAFLQKYFKSIVEGSGTVFVPLCGKTKDIGWLLSQGYQVVGVELSEIAVEQLFDNLNIKVEVSDLGSIKSYRSNHLTVYTGNIFDLNAEMLGPVDCVYDRAALVAMPEDTRRAYTEHLVAITHGANQFVVCFEYDQNQMKGPPFSINPELLSVYYSKEFEIDLLERSKVEGKLKRKVDATEHAWWLKAIT